MTEDGFFYEIWNESNLNSMTKKAAIIIGVGKTGRMPALPAATKSAIQFQSWANHQGFEVKMHTDEKGAVSVQQIKDSIRGLVEEKNLSQLIIYFSGHGVLRSANDEQWLLSGAPEDSNEAINLTSSIAIARNSGIPHIIFISDACRCKPEDLLVLQVTGQQVFPNAITPSDRPDVDIFYATIPGNPALEIKQAEAADGYQGIYTHCLLKGLNGEVPEVITKQDVNGDIYGVVEAFELKKYLRREVPQEVQKTSILLKQIPDAEITSRLPQYLSKIKTIEPSFIKEEFMEFERQTKLDFTSDLSQASYRTEVFNRIEEVNNSELDISFEMLRNAKGRESFETGTGFTIIGQQIRDAYTKSNQFDIFTENGYVQIRIHDIETKSIIIEMQGGCGVPLAVLPNFIGTVVIQDGQVVNVNYSPSRYSPRYQQYVNSENELNDRRAVIATAARFGRFQLEGNADEHMNLANYLRYMKAFDPTLGLYASYAYAQAGITDGIYSIYKYMRKETEPVIHDVAMLAKLLSPRDNISLQHLAPFCPMLTQGWSYLSIDDHIVSKSIRDLSKHLVPGLWTTFSKVGMQKVKETINEFL